MRKFDFRLEPVLKCRQIAEEQAAAKQAVAREEYQFNYNSLCEARSKLENAVSDQQGLDVFDMFNRLAYCEQLTAEIEKCKAQVELSRHRLESCQQNLVKAMQDRSVMEKLRQKQLQLYNARVSAAEQKETDELALRKHNPAETRWQDQD